MIFAEQIGVLRYQSFIYTDICQFLTKGAMPKPNHKGKW